jgi:M6 family metalloprotease-like protein
MRRVQTYRYGLLVVAAFLIAGTALGMPANPEPVLAIQPDGTKIALHIRGDEKVNWQEDLNGYPVERRATGQYVYVAPPGKALVQADLVVGKVDPATAGVQKGMPPRPGAKGVVAPMPFANPALSEPARRVAPAGKVRNVVILMKFANHGNRTLPSPADVNQLFNAVGGHPTLAPSGSVRDIYLANSYGKFELNSTVFAWVTLPHTEQYYADGNSGSGAKMFEAITDALTAADSLINFKDFDKDGDGFVDAIAFLHSGYGAEWGGADADGTDFKNRIWSHRWSIPTWTSAEGVKVSAYHISPALWSTSGTAIGRIGVISHETGHFFGLPDLYDGGAGSGVGSWCMMSNSWGFDGSQYFPPHFSAWAKIQLGWVTPTLLTAPGVYSAPASATNQIVFKITAGYPAGEYLLVENRQPVLFDQKIPAGTGGGKGGLAVWHIDEKKGTNTDGGFPGQAGYPGNNKHYMVSLLQADGKYDLEKGSGRGDGDDVFRGGFVSEISHATVPNTDAYQGGTIVNTKNTLSEISTSGATVTFKYSNGDPPLPPVVTTGRRGFAWANNATAASYAPNAIYAFNSAGGAITVTRTGTGTYAVKFAGLGGNGKAGGTVQVTAYGPGTETAKVTNWTSIGADFVVYVRCATPSGSPTDAQYTVLVTWP